MDSLVTQTSKECYKITCKNCPSEFILDKNLAKEYFRQFGKLKRLIFKPKLRICVVEYTSRDGYLNALNNSGEYKGTIFKVSSEKSPESKKRKLKNPEPIWIDDDEVGAELAAMGGFAPKSYNNFSDVGSVEILSEASKVEKVPKLKRSWATETQKVKKVPKIKEKMPQKEHTAEILKYGELINVIKSQAVTVEEKFRILDARDKLIRIKLKNKIKLKSSPTVGTCPDMCPEKERLMRETQHQVALYEQEDNGRSMDQSKAIKQYSRSSADQESPLPHELRPVYVLQMTMAYLMHNIIDMCETNDVNLAEWYHFMWDRTRGIRKDITQQELCGQGAVELIEQCARFHIHCSARLVAEDPSVFDQKINTENLTKCLQSLKYMYHDLQLKGVQCPNEAEFRAYIILLNLNDGNFMWEVQELPQEIQKSKEVKFALDVYSAIDKNNYVKFFKLVYSTTYLNACVLMRYFVQVRITAIKTLLKCYTSRAFKSMYPLSELKHLLAFDDIESTIDFMQAYGLFVNEDGTRVVLDKDSFVLPEIPYLLDRSLNVVESKRTCSVGKIVCGKELPPKTFEQHMPQDSFDAKGYLLFEDLLEESDFDQTEMQLEEIAQVPFTTDNSSVASVDSAAVSEIFQQPTKEAIAGSIFTQTKQEDVPVVPKQPTLGLFSQPKETQKSIFAKDTASIFGGTFLAKPDKTDPGLKDETDSNQWSSSNSSIFALRKDTSPSKPSPIFGGIAVTKPLKNIPPTVPKKGGFHFDLPVATQQTKPKVLPTPTPALQPAPQPFAYKFQAPVPQATEDFEELQRKKKEEEEEKLRRETKERKKQEAERKLLAKKKKEEEKLKALKKQKQEAELRRRMEELRKEEECRKNKEIRETVESVLRDIVEQVHDEVCRERLLEIKQKIQERILLKIIHKWQQTVLKNKRKRKAMDCSPVWVSTKTVEQSAEELYTTSQELTLKLRKRYKYGKALDIEPIEEDKINKIDLFELTYAALNQRFFNLRGTLQKNIFWKVEISLPDHYELRNGLVRIEDTLKDAFRWEDRNGTIMLVEQMKPNPVQSVTYCMERQRGLYVRYGDANGIIFIAKDFNSLLQRRILENLKDLGVFTKVPIVVILQEYKEGDCKLQSLIEENIVSDYLILIQNITPRNLIHLVEEGLVFLASKVEKPPPLELDTLSSFLKKYLCTEIWKKANSFAKWNSHYKSSLRDPNIIVSLYNEAVAKLTEIVLNKSCFEYPNFPEVFKDFLQSEIPDCLPCNYYYFPKFWKSETYISKLEKILKNFVLPKWSDKWPPGSELELEVNLSKYCTRVFTEPEKPFYKIMSVLLRDLDPNVNFDDIIKVLWTDVIEVLALEKLKETNLSLAGTSFETKSIFNQFVVVYDVSTLESYNKSDWFYISNPMIKKYVEQQMRHENGKDKKADTTTELDLSIDLDKTISEVTSKLDNKQNNVQLRKELAEFNEMLNDLETSIKIHKKISSLIGENLKKAIADN